MEKVVFGPLQVNPFNVTVGVTVNKAVIGVLPGLSAVKDGIFPVPLFGVNPIFVGVDHANCVPATGELKLIAAVLVLVHTV